MFNKILFKPNVTGYTSFEYILQKQSLHNQNRELLIHIIMAVVPCELTSDMSHSKHPSDLNIMLQRDEFICQIKSLWGPRWGCGLSPLVMQVDQLEWTILLLPGSSVTEGILTISGAIYTLNLPIMGGSTK